MRVTQLAALVRCNANLMGNTKSAFSVPEGNNNNSQNDDDEDYGFHKRGQSLRYLRKQTPVDLSRNPSLGVADQLKRTNSLPMKVGPPKMRKSILGRSKLAPADHRNRPSSPVEVGLRPIPVQGRLSQTNYYKNMLIECRQQVSI